jgi:phage baseplate assembly protein W
MSADFLGSGWKFPIQPDATGRLGWVAGEANVEQSLRILLQTALGERVMRFDYGTRAPELVFAPGSQRYLRLLETSVSEAVRDYEPRVTLDSVLAEVDPRAPESVTVSVTYRVRATNTRGNLVYPFYTGTTETSA